MKKVLNLLLIVCMALFFTACANNSTEKTQSEKAEQKALLVNICEGNLYAAMPEEDATAYMENELGLTKTDYIVNGEQSTNAFYEIPDVNGLGKTKVTLKFNDGLLSYISFYFTEASWDSAMAVVNQRLGDDFTTEDNNSYTRYNWVYDDASLDIYKEKDEEDLRVVLYVNYNMEYQY